MSTKIKYPRTPHLPWSPGKSADDKVIDNINFLTETKDFVVTEKLDGGNMTWYRDTWHSRSLDSKPHHSDSYVINMWAQRKHKIPKGWRVCGENLYAQRSIAYNNLPSYFMVFAIFDETNTMLNVDATIELCYAWDLEYVPVLYIGDSFTQAQWAWSQKRNRFNSEGYVIRYAGDIYYNEFDKYVGKYVRENHVETTACWRRRDDYKINRLA